MLRTIESLYGRTVAARDGEIGTVDQIYFDDEAWGVRYLVVETGSWINKRKVLISPYSFKHADPGSSTVEVDLTQQQVKDSPNIDTDKPVSRQHETEYLGYYGYPTYWGGAYLWGVGAYPISLYRSVVTVAQDLNGDHSIHDSLHANPQRLRARFAVTLAPEESAQRRDHPYHLVERRWFFWTRLLAEHVSAVYLVSRKEQRCVQLRTGSSDTYEPRDPPRYDHVQRERLLHPLHL